MQADQIQAILINQNQLFSYYQINLTEYFQVLSLYKQFYYDANEKEPSKFEENKSLLKIPIMFLNPLNE